MKKKNIIIVLSVIIVIAAFLGVYFITENKEDKNTNKDNNKTENKEKTYELVDGISCNMPKFLL